MGRGGSAIGRMDGRGSGRAAILACALLASGCTGGLRRTPPPAAGPATAGVASPPSAYRICRTRSCVGGDPKRRQYFDERRRRYYFFDPVKKRYYWEDGSPRA